MKRIEPVEPALHDDGLAVYSDAPMIHSSPEPTRAAARERRRAPVSAGGVAAPEPAHGVDRVPEARLRVAIVGATGYVGGELIRLLARHPRSRSSACGPGPRGDRSASPRPSVGDRPAVDSAVPVDAVFLALPHGGRRPVADGSTRGATVIDLGPDFRLRDRGRLPALVRLRASATGAPRARRLWAAGAPSRRARRGRTAARTSRDRGPPGCYPRRRSSPWRRWRGPGSSATSSSTPRAAYRAPAASRRPTSCSARSTRA